MDRSRSTRLPHRPYRGPVRTESAGDQTAHAYSLMSRAARHPSALGNAVHGRRDQGLEGDTVVRSARPAEVDLIAADGPETMLDGRPRPSVGFEHGADLIRARGR